ncbi:MAG: 4Fe-4S binding protein, partial [Deltaproteobacteria bacterium]|nr:4Fe-4S binding protein [Deltaproteobacteria bacterium]
PPVEYTKVWAENHGIKDNRRSMFMEYFGPRRNLTANASDRWHRTGADSIFAIEASLLREVFEIRKNTLDAGNAQSIEKIAAGFPKHEPIPGFGQDEIKRIASRLCEASNGIVLFGGAETSGKNATVTHVAALLLNYLTGSIGKSFIYGGNYCLSKVTAEKEISGLLSGNQPDSTNLLFVYGANPAYTMPAHAKKRMADFIVCLAHEFNEMTDIADLVLPVHHPLESWGDYEVTGEIRGLMQPVRSPLYGSKLAGDLIIEIALKAGKPMLYENFKRYVTARWATFTDNDEKNWERILQEGGAFRKTRMENTISSVTLRSDINLSDFTTASEISDNRFTLAISFSSLLYDGRGAPSEWLMETPDSLSQTAWEIPAEVPAVAAESLGIHDGDVIALKSPAGEIKCAAIVSPDLHEKTIALRAGGGRIFSKEGYVSGNAFNLIGESYDTISGSPVLARKGITIEKTGTGVIASVSGGSDSEDRFLAPVMKLSDAIAGRFPRMTRHGEEYPDPNGKFKGAIAPMPHEEIEGTRPDYNVNTLHTHPEHRWGMVIDLDRCTGCGACVTACYAP